jgi:hypothetical protein
MAVANAVNTLDITLVMTPERIVGIVIWALSHDILTDEIFKLIDSLPEEYEHTLEDNLDTMIQSLRCGRRDMKMRQSVMEYAQSELESTLRLKRQWHD